MINVIPEEEINCESFISQLRVTGLNQMKLPAVENQSDQEDAESSRKKMEIVAAF